jgi:hypothetical protein
MASTSRKDERYPSKAHVHIADVSDTEPVLKDLSLSGCCIESSDFLDIVPHSRYTLDITPEEDAKLEKFALDIESKWVRTKRAYSQSGFVFLVPPDETNLRRYVEYLSQHKPTDK